MIIDLKYLSCCAEARQALEAALTLDRGHEVMHMSELVVCFVYDVVCLDGRI